MLSVCLSYIKYNAGVNTYNTECPLYSFFCQRSHTHKSWGIIGKGQGGRRGLIPIALLLVVSAWRVARESFHMISPQYGSRLLRGP